MMFLVLVPRAHIHNNKKKCTQLQGKGLDRIVSQNCCTPCMHLCCASESQNDHRKTRTKQTSMCETSL